MDALLRSTLGSCLGDALERLAWPATVSEHTSLEGPSILITEPDQTTPVVLAIAVPPSRSPFDDVVRDRARSVASRLHVPWVLVTSFRRTVLYSVDNITRRRAPEELVVTQVGGPDVLSVDDVMIAAHRVGATESLRQCLATVRDGAPVTPEKAPFLIGRLTNLFDELLACTDRSDHQTVAVERFGTSVLGYALLSQRYAETLPPLQVPYGTRSRGLLLDLLGAYLREANRQGHQLFPESLADVVVPPERELLFASVATDLVHLVENIRLERFNTEEIQTVVDAVLLWCARVRQTPVPTIDAIDLAIMASPLADLPHQSEPRILEIGSTLGMFGVRTRLLLPRAETCVFAATDLEERQTLLRASGQLAERDEVAVLRSIADSQRPWDVVCAAFTHTVDAYQLRTLLEAIDLTDTGVVVLYLPLRVLRDASFAEFRRTVVDHFDVRWVFTADAEPLAEPDNGVCCLILSLVREGASQEPSNFGFIRVALSSLIPPAASLRTFTLDRAERLRVFLRYLLSSERGKINDEVVVRRVARSTLHLRSTDDHAGWDDLIVPPDVIANILRSLSGKLRPLHELGDAFSGIRTGANDVLAPDVGEIADGDLEDRYWQRTLSDGRQVDNTVITSADELSSIAGIPSADRRLLLLPDDRSQLEGTHIHTLLERAERDGVHTRTSVRGRDAWWHLEEPPTPHVIVPKQQRQRWLITTNPAHAFITDACIGVTLNDPMLADAVSIWMNSTLGLFLSELVQTSDHVADVTVRDVKEFLVPTEEILRSIDTRKFKDLLYRPQHTLADEYGTDDADVVRPSMVRRDRRRLDRLFMEELFGMTEEEQRWVYRFALAWRGSQTNVRHLANALAAQISLQQRIQPMWQWYAPRMEQLPQGTVRSILLPDGVTRAEHAQSMFTHQVSLFRGAKKGDVIDCSTADEAELITILANLGKRAIDLPVDAPLLAEVLPLVQQFAQRVDAAIADVLQIVPGDLREAVRTQIRHVMVS